MEREDQKNSGVLSIEQQWLYSNLHREGDRKKFNGFIFEEILRGTNLDLFKNIDSFEGYPTNLLKEWLPAKNSQKWLIRNIEENGTSYNGEDIWEAIAISLLRNEPRYINNHSSYEAEEALIFLLNKRKDIWINNKQRCNFMFRSALYSGLDLKNLLSFILDSVDIDVNSRLNIGNDKYLLDDTSKLVSGNIVLRGSLSEEHPLLLTRNTDNRKKMIDMGVDFFTPYGKERPWDSIISKQYDDELKAMVREIAATTLLPKSQTPAEDVWAALSTAEGIMDKKKMLGLGSKQGIWKLRSNKEGTKGKTTLMYLADKGYLDSLMIVKSVPSDAWGDIDDKGWSFIDYLYEKWLVSGGACKIDVGNVQSYISLEKHANLAWKGINHGGNMSDDDDLLLIKAPEILKTGEEESRDKFWNIFFKNENSKERLFKAIISVPVFHGLEDEENRVQASYKEEFAVWRKSLQWARMDNGKRWVEEYKEVADAAVMLSFLEKISKTSTNNTESRELVKEEDKTLVLTDLFGAGGGLDSALEQKDRICEETRNRGNCSRFGRRSHVELFDEMVLRNVLNLDVILSEWRALYEKVRLSMVVNNIPDERKCVVNVL